MNLNWRKLYFGCVSPEEVQEAVKDDRWQSIRRSMKGTSLEQKYTTLSNYLLGMRLEARRSGLSEEERNHMLRMAYVRITNYVTALSRGGLIKPSDYR